ncbi:MAG TPA: hypothetical protein VKT25_10050 [Ktedonobacteraceae bacterium]|nr:hypothetical protein [Ktedonobacteraceae bacterium]
MPLELDQEFCRGGFFIPRQLRRDLIAPGVKDCTRSLVYFFASLTIGWRARFVVLSYGDIIQGPIINQKRWTDELSGLTSDHAIRDALAQAKANNMIEVKYTPWGTAYALHKRYWQQMLAILPRMAPKYDVLYRSVYNPDADPLTDESQSAYNLAASGDSDAPSPAYKLEATKPDSQKKQGPSAYNLVADNRENMPPLAYNLVASRQQKQGSVAYKLEASESEIPPVVTPGRLKIVSKPAPAKEEDTDPLLTIGLQGCLQLGSGAAYKLLATEQLPGQAPAGADASPKDTSKIRNKDTKDTYYVAGVSRDASVAPDGASADALGSSLRGKEDEDQPAASKANLSDSQPQPDASSLAWLHESSQAENPDIAYYRTQLRDARTELHREKEYAETCDPRDRPAVERRIQALEGSSEYFEKLLIEMIPKPPLTDSNWQQQLFGVLCETFNVPAQDTGGTDLAGQIGRAANILKRYHRRPEEVPSLYVEFKRKYAWKKGRSLGGLILDFANSAAVLNG